ncbi:plasmid stabilization protein [Rhizobium sp. Root708]|uniref:type II toxin-antitoxin system RelE/ParE family toxin n=1 Tax=Rhizobium sp. Root708 TaxID=1736592 RepID=UPI0006FC7B01|nr:type II toxin-antitoxin system RelE/ParE family toxin [Rhizobium sp. Root708]KRB62726.1 plasmid stabilization protein [Rhizobium sp. Root708]
MGRYTLSPRAEEELREIWRSIAPDNERAAGNLLRRFLEKFALAAGYVEIGPRGPELSAAARILIEGRYVAVHEPRPRGILVVTIVHGSREIGTWLG